MLTSINIKPLFLLTALIAYSVTDARASDVEEPLFETLKSTTKSKASGNLFTYGRLTLRQLNFKDLGGWREDSQQKAIPAFLRSCSVLATGNSKGGYKVPGSKAQWQRVCSRAGQLVTASQKEVQSFFEEEFKPLEVIDKKRPSGLFTGYFEPEVVGSLTKTKKYKYPLYAKPKELVRLNGKSLYSGKHRHDWGIIKNGKAQKYYSRKQIENGALKGRGLELVYLANPVDAFFIHVQGSTRIKLTNGKVKRIGFAAKNGHPYKSIGRVLIEWGELERHKVSMGSIRNWAKRNPSRVKELLAHNRSFIFFRKLKNVRSDEGPLGAQSVPLTAMRSMAVDKHLHAYGVPMWIETFAPDPQTKREVHFHRLMISQDTGSAIKGAVRGDIYFGTGLKAGKIAGMLKHPGRLILLVPK